ncbi:cell division protein FtsA [Parvularcula lutaonensis]|uniref:Uncharacterized protein n=1 Tax=Parvularcula lutaonensis TaxID=491923 RepID=A0ABV7M7C2_9PROT|nr:hypothetical protein [Parvularcula lutaonensis]GGY41575.1 hypothetical protein GCM10007148_07720 [Parvularcula lutaonensis]
MTGTLFLSDALTAYDGGGGAWPTAPSLFGRKGTLKASAGEILRDFDAEGPVVACLPLSATSCQTLRVQSTVGRQVTQNDISDALEAALGRAGAEGRAVVSAEPSRILLDGEEAKGSAVGKAAQSLEVEVTAFLSPLSLLAQLERVTKEAGMTLAGVLPLEEAAAASLRLANEVSLPVILVDRWHTKIIAFRDEAPSRSSVFRVGAGHIEADLAVTFGIPDDEAAKLARQMVLGRVQQGREEASLVAVARLEELAQRTATIAKAAGIDASRVILLGLPIAPPVEEAFHAQGIAVQGPGLALEKTDPAILAFAKGASMLAAGAIPRTAATALHLSKPREKSGVLAWLRRNF